MKATITAILILVFICSLSYFTREYTIKVSDILEENISQCDSFVRENDWQNAEAYVKKARWVFSEKSNVLESFLIHEDIERLSDILTNIEISIKDKDTTAASSNIEIFRRRLLELTESDKITLNNIL